MPGCWSEADVTAPVGARTRAEVEQNLMSADLRLTDTEVAQLEEIVQGAAGTIRASTPLRPAVVPWESRVGASTHLNRVIEKMGDWEDRQPPVLN
jgi:hypothetical protein